MGHAYYNADLVGNDLETGGLNGYVTLESGERVHGSLYYPILEMAFVLPCVSTRGELSALGFNGEPAKLVVGIRLNEESTKRMDPWAMKQHTKSGLLERLNTGEGFDALVDTNEEAEAFVIDWLKRMGVRPWKRGDDDNPGSGAILFGNNVGFDLSFMNAQMPDLAKWFHYRVADISGVNVLKRTIWRGVGLPEPQKELNHTALADINESMDELNGYTARLQALLAEQNITEMMK